MVCINADVFEHRVYANAISSGPQVVAFSKRCLGICH